jgi:hypothetical protein
VRVDSLYGYLEISKPMEIAELYWRRLIFKLDSIKMVSSRANQIKESLDEELRQ